MRRVIPLLSIGVSLCLGCDGSEPSAPEYGLFVNPVGRAPLVVSIHNIDSEEIDVLTVEAGEPFTLKGVAGGDSPFTFAWSQETDGDVQPLGDASDLIDCAIETPGTYEIVLEVTGAHGTVGSDRIDLFVLPAMVPNPGSGDPIPPVVSIYDISMVEIDSKTVNAGDPFTLIGVAVGNTPFAYFWLQSADGTTVAIGSTSYLIDYAIDEPGEYVISFEVIDANGLSASDQVVVTVLEVNEAPLAAMGFESECFDLHTGNVLSMEWLNYEPPECEFRFAFNALRQPHAVVFQNRVQDVEIAITSKRFNDVSVDDVAAAVFTTSLIDVPFENTTLLKTNVGDVFKIAPRSESDQEVTFWWARLIEAANQAPFADPGGPYTEDEGSAVSFDGGGSSDPNGDVLTYSWDFGDGDTGSDVNPSHIYADNGNYSICLTVTDPDGLSDTSCATANINNVAPAVGPITAPSEPVAVGTGITVSAGFTDPGRADSHAASIDWGDATGDYLDPASSPVSAGHSYATAGVYTVTVAVTDDDGDSDQAVYEYLVAYDASAGFVTGGGWIDSPQGAYKPDPALGGKATFGFVAKYKKGAAVPSGQTEFRFHAADMNFQSSSYEWLVIAGSDYARYKGTGTINGMGGYKFMLWARDGSPDTFRIRIWEEDEATAVETDVYDNGFDQAIGGGSIVVHSN